MSKHLNYKYYSPAQKRYILFEAANRVSADMKAEAEDQNAEFVGEFPLPTFRDFHKHQGGNPNQNVSGIMPVRLGKGPSKKGRSR